MHPDEQKLHALSVSSYEFQQLKRLQMVSWAESTTLVLLVCIAVPLKHVFAWPVGVKILGPIHGITFLVYTWTVLQTVSGGGWKAGDIARLFAVSLLPFAGYFNILWLRQRK